MNDFPVIRIEIEHLKQSVLHAFNAQNSEFNKMVADEIEKQLQPELIQHRVTAEVKNLVDQSIKKISEDYRLQAAITSLVSDQLTEIIRGHNE